MMVLRKNLMLRRLAPFATWPAADPQHRARPRRMGGMSAYLYILRASTVRITPERHAVASRRASRNMKLALSTASPARRRPVNLVFHQEFQRIEDAVAAKRQVKGWRRERKEALIRGDFAALPELSRPPSRRGPRAAPEDEVGADAIKGRPHPKEAAPGSARRTARGRAPRPPRRMHQARLAERIPRDFAGPGRPILQSAAGDPVWLAGPR